MREREREEVGFFPFLPFEKEKESLKRTLFLLLLLLLRPLSPRHLTTMTIISDDNKNQKASVFGDV